MTGAGASAARERADVVWLRETLRCSEAAVAAGAIPFAGLVVLDGQPVGEGVNEVLVRHDPTAHAEVQAMRAACTHLRRSRLEGAVLYASGEPCAMCLTSAAFAGIARVVYAADAALAARYGFRYGEASRLLAPRDAWTMVIEHRPIDGAEAPFEAWRQRSLRRPF